MDQLQEVYRLDSAVVNRLREKFFVLPDYVPRQIQINTIVEKDLAVHPYFSYKKAAAIAAYRFQHGNFTSVEELVKLKLISEKEYQKIKPYITLNP
jgi:hypothetical protein